MTHTGLSVSHPCNSGLCKDRGSSFQRGCSIVRGRIMHPIVLQAMLSTCAFCCCCFLFKKKKIFFWLHWVLVAAGGIVSCGKWTLSCGMWGLIRWPGRNPRHPALGAQSLSHWDHQGSPSTWALWTSGVQGSAGERRSHPFGGICVKQRGMCVKRHLAPFQSLCSVVLRARTL